MQDTIEKRRGRNESNRSPHEPSRCPVRTRIRLESDPRPGATQNPPCLDRGEMHDAREAGFRFVAQKLAPHCVESRPDTADCAKTLRKFGIASRVCRRSTERQVREWSVALENHYTLTNDLGIPACQTVLLVTCCHIRDCESSSAPSPS